PARGGDVHRHQHRSLLPGVARLIPARLTAPSVDPLTSDKDNATMFGNPHILGQVAQLHAATQPSPASAGQHRQQLPSTAPTPRLWRHRRNALIAALVLLAVAGIGVTGCSKTPPTYRVTATVPVGKSPGGVAVDSGTRTVYVTNIKPGAVSVIDAST